MSRDPYQGVRHALTIIPLIQARQGITIDELMEATGLDEVEISEELQNLVMLCGVPPYSPNNYVSLWIEDRQVYIRFAEQFERPVRLVVPEALALLKLWIDQGATGTVRGILSPKTWRPLPTKVNP